MKLAMGFADTIHVPPVNVDSHILITGKFVKSSKKMCGTPDASMTMSENWVFVRAPLTSAGALKGCPGPAECDSRIADPKAGMDAVPSVHGTPLQKNV
jgi:hypothetical protein